MRPAWPSRGVIVFRRAGRAASLHPQPQGRTATSASPTPHPPTPGHGCASRSTPVGNASPTQAPRTQGPFAQRTEPLRCSHGPHRSQPPLPVQAETGVPGGSGGVGPRLALRTLPGNRENPSLARPWACSGGRPPARGPVHRSLPPGDMGTRKPTLPPRAREPGFLGGNCSCHLSPSARPDPDGAVGPGWLGGDRRDKASAARAGCGIGLCSHGPATGPACPRHSPRTPGLGTDEGPGSRVCVGHLGGGAGRRGPPWGGRCFLADHTGLPRHSPSTLGTAPL